MRTVLGLALAGLMAAASGSAAQEKGEKIDAKKLVGKWEPVDEKLPPGAKVVIEFTKDGKVTVDMDFGGKKDKIEATYKLDGNKLTMTLKAGDKEKTDEMTVTKLTGGELALKDEKGKTDEFKKVKEEDKK